MIRTDTYFDARAPLVGRPSPARRYPYRIWTERNLAELPQLAHVPADLREEMEVVAHVLPFRVNSYLVDELIDWDDVPDDPLFRLTFPQREMLAPEDYDAMAGVIRSGASRAERTACANRIRSRLNPHPAGQMTKNVPKRGGERVPGVQHKYAETVLLFPRPGQTCHAYCSYCFRWPQFVGDKDLRFAAKEVDPLVAYLESHPEVTDVLVTGGDPLVMKTAVLRRYVEPLLDIPSIRSVRIGTKSVAWWPQRFTTDEDADDLLRLFEQVVASGRHLALMAHYSHPRELSTTLATRAVRRIRKTGAVVRCQAPLVRHVNDDPDVWAELWRAQVAVGAVPYYMFMERDTGPRDYFAVPIARAFSVYQDAVRQVSGLARTARGPVMSCTPGKVQVVGVTDEPSPRFALRMLQARDPSWVGRLFFADYDADARWIDELQPTPAERFFFSS